MYSDIAALFDADSTGIAGQAVYEVIPLVFSGNRIFGMKAARVTCIDCVVVYPDTDGMRS